MRFAPCVACLFLGIPLGFAHQTLSESMEVNLHDPATIRIEITIHAPELDSAIATGVDPSNAPPEWLGGLSNEEIDALKNEAIAFIRRNYSYSLGGSAEAEVSEIFSKEEIHFDSSDAIRNPPADTKLPLGCFLATISLANPGPPMELAIAFSEEAQKRLLLAISRPGEFPRVHDLGPGDLVRISLPIPPLPETPRSSFSLIPVIGILVGIALSLAVAAWKMRQRV